MEMNPLDGKIIRDAVLYSSDLGYILAADPQREEQEIAHVITVRLNAGQFNSAEGGFSAHTCAIISVPQAGLLEVSSDGFYSVETSKGLTTGNIFNQSIPVPNEQRFGVIRSVREICGKAYAVGFEGMVYQLNDLNEWTIIDAGLPKGFDIEAIHGFSETEIYAVGFQGELWRYDGHQWLKLDLPTNLCLTNVICAEDGYAYIAGEKGILISGRNSTWQVVAQEETIDDLWGLAWFNDVLFISSLSNVYVLKEEGLEAINFGTDKPKSCYKLNAVKEVLWSIGTHDIFSYNTKKWARVV